MGDTPCYSAESYIPVSNVSPFTPSSSKYQNETKSHVRNYSENRVSRMNQSVSNLVPPWKSRQYSCGVIGLHEEINDFYGVMRPTDQETELRLKVVEHITKIVHSLWPHAKVEVFGSFRTGLYLPSSDIDLVVMGEWKNIPLSTLSNALERNGIMKNDINIIASATVPIVRMLHTPSQIRVDISFNMINGVKSAKLIKTLVKEHPVLPKLVFVLKQFLVHRNMNEVYNGGMSSYCLTLLIVSFLQGYHKPKAPPSSNLGTLLLEFFELYGVNFNYEKVSIHFQNGGNYRPRFRAENLLSVEDPLVEGHDVAKGTYLMNLLKISFQNAFHVLSQQVLSSAAQGVPPVSYLHRIFEVEESVISNRKRMKQNYSSISRMLSQLLENINISSSGGPSQKSKGNVNSIRNLKRKKS